jgi:ApbE superfamily uncharacterized protein (UPF0280 family)
MLKDIIREHFEYKETIVTLLATDKRHIEAAKSAILKARGEIEDHIARRPEFRTSFEPVDPSPDTAPLPVRRMEKAAEATFTGPMAAVAGTIAWSAVEAMKAAGATFAVCDNGGDIAFLLDRELNVGLYTGEACPLKGVIFKIQPTRGRIKGVCTSSAKVGPSISLGRSDAAVVFADDVALADAAATALGNMVKSEDRPIVENALESVSHVNGVSGAIVVIGDKVGLWGNVPNMTRNALDPDLITRGKVPL